MSAIKPKYILNNRTDKHAFANDATRCAEYLQHIIDSFVDELFAEDHKYTYKTIYLHFLDLWKKTCDQLKTVKPKLKNVIIDASFFATEYAPQI